MQKLNQSKIKIRVMRVVCCHLRAKFDLLNFEEAAKSLDVQYICQRGRVKKSLSDFGLEPSDMICSILAKRKAR